MDTQKDSPEVIKERLLQEELKNNPLGTFSDGIHRSLSGNLSNLGWKYTGIFIVLLIIGYVIVKIAG